MFLGVNLPWTAAAGPPPLAGTEGPPPLAGAERRPAGPPGRSSQTRAGWDFGEGPPGWWSAARTPLPRDFAETAADLDALVRLGVRDLRLFVLGHGVNYPVGALLVDPYAPPPPLPASFVADFATLLEVAAARGVRLWPSLLSFEFFGPLRAHGQGVTSGGRAPLVFGRYGSEPEISRFLDAALAPLLKAARRRPEAIGAFELINEPEWATRALRDLRRPVPARHMRSLVRLGVERIVAAGLRASVGFIDARADFLDGSLVDELRRLGARGQYVHQLHHYPGAHRPRRLEPHASLPIRPCVVGELPTVMGVSARGPHMRWQGAGLAEDDPARFLRARLELIEGLGYPGAFVWGLHSSDDATNWERGQAAQLAEFCGLR